MSKPALGRGLGALLGGNTGTRPAAAVPSPQPEPSSVIDVRERVLRVKLDQIKPSPLQPRKDFTPEALQELAASIKEQGIVQPLIVRDQGTHYELIAGERRWRAAQLLDLPDVPVIVREADDAAVLELALIENLQRENLNPMEEALGYQQLIDRFHLRQEDVAMKVGKSRVAIANSLRLLKLAPELQTYVREGRLSAGHAKVILSLALPDEQKLAAERVLKEGLSVRATEKLVATLLRPHEAHPAGNPNGAAIPRDPHVASLEGKLREKFGTKVQLRYRKGKGALEIRFFNDADLERILNVLDVSAD